MIDNLIYKRKKYFETEDFIVYDKKCRFLPDFNSNINYRRLSLPMRIIAMECGFLLDSLVSIIFNI